MVRICRGILCFHSYFFCLETTLMREQLDESDFRRFIFFSRKCHSGSYDTPL